VLGNGQKPEYSTCGNWGESVVVVAPHPDDESIACGGLIGLLARRSVVVNIIVDTDGCGSHPNSFDYPPARLAKLRAEETLSALSHLELKSAACGFAVCRPLCTH
jgi:LmbE family N-acetylglucosaminyl deacetylase